MNPGLVTKIQNPNSYTPPNSRSHRTQLCSRSPKLRIPSNEKVSSALSSAIMKEVRTERALICLGRSTFQEGIKFPALKTDSLLSLRPSGRQLENFTIIPSFSIVSYSFGSPFFFNCVSRYLNTFLMMACEMECLFQKWQWDLNLGQDLFFLIFEIGIAGTIVV